MPPSDRDPYAWWCRQNRCQMQSYPSLTFYPPPSPSWKALVQKQVGESLPRCFAMSLISDISLIKSMPPMLPLIYHQTNQSFGIMDDFASSSDMLILHLKKCDFLVFTIRSVSFMELSIVFVTVHREAWLLIIGILWFDWCNWVSNKFIIFFPEAIPMCFVSIYQYALRCRFVCLVSRMTYQPASVMPLFCLCSGWQYYLSDVCRPLVSARQDDSRNDGTGWW